jgi:hypothetical protein
MPILNAGSFFLLTANVAIVVTAANVMTVARRVISGTAGDGEGEAVGSEAKGLGDGLIEGEGVGVTLAVGLGSGLGEEEGV